MSIQVKRATVFDPVTGNRKAVTVGDPTAFSLTPGDRKLGVSSWSLETPTNNLDSQRRLNLSSSGEQIPPQVDPATSFQSALIGLLKSAQNPSGDGDLLKQRNDLINQRFNAIGQQTPNDLTGLDPAQQSALRNGSAAGLENQLGGINTAMQERQNQRANARQILMDTLGIVKDMQPTADKAPTTSDITNYEYAVTNNGYKGSLSDWVQSYAQAKDTSGNSTGGASVYDAPSDPNTAVENIRSVYDTPSGKADVIKHGVETNSTFARLPASEQGKVVDEFFNSLKPSSNLMASSDPNFGLGGRRVTQNAPEVGMDYTALGKADRKDVNDALNATQKDLNAFKLDKNQAVALLQRQFPGLKRSEIDNRLIAADPMKSPKVAARMSVIQRAAQDLMDYQKMYNKVWTTHGHGSFLGTVTDAATGGMGVRLPLTGGGVDIKIPPLFAFMLPEAKKLKDSIPGLANSLGQAVGIMDTTAPNSVRTPSYFRDQEEGNIPTLADDRQNAEYKFQQLFKRLNAQYEALVANPLAANSDTQLQITPTQP